MFLFYETRAFPYLNALICKANLSLWFLFSFWLSPTSMSLFSVCEDRCDVSSPFARMMSTGLTHRLAEGALLGLKRYLCGHNGLG